jgi:hypothetical protein
LGWERYVGREGCVIGMHTFGASAPLKELQKKFGFETDRIVVSRRNSWPGISTCPVFIKNGQGRMRTEGAAPLPSSQEQEDFSFAHPRG